MDNIVFNLTINRLEQYSAIYRNLYQGGLASENPLMYQLREIITSMINHLTTNAKGQV